MPNGYEAEDAGRDPDDLDTVKLAGDSAPLTVTLRDRNVTASLERGHDSATLPRAPSVHDRGSAPVATPGGPPFGGSPTIPPAMVVPAPTPQEPFLVRHRRKVLGALVGFVALVGLAVVLFVVTHHSDREQATSAVASSSSEFSRVLRVAQAGDRLDTAQQTGREAKSALDRLDAEISDVNALEDTKLRQPVSALLQAERAMLAKLGELGDLEPNRRSFDRWDGIKGTLDSSKSQIAAAIPAVQALDLSGEPGFLVAPADADAAVERLDQIITNADEVLEKALRARKRARARERRNRIARASLEGYGSRVRTIFQGYASSRSETSDYIESIREGGGVVPSDSASKVNGFISDRRETISSLQAISPPSQFSDFTDEHQALLRAPERSIEGLEALVKAINWSLQPPETPIERAGSQGLDDFESISSEVGGIYNSSVSSWESTFAQYAEKYGKVKIPKIPDF